MNGKPVFHISGLANYAAAERCMNALDAAGIDNGITAGGICLHAFDELDDGKQLEACVIAEAYGATVHVGPTPLAEYQEQQRHKRKAAKQ